MKSETCHLRQVLEDEKGSKLPSRFEDGCLDVLGAHLQ